MTSKYSLVSSSDQEWLFNEQSFKIQQKHIAKQKSQPAKSRKTHFKQADNYIYKIACLNKTESSNQNNGLYCQSLGALLIDKFLMKGNFLERSYNKESVEFKYSFFNQNTDFKDRSNLECDELMQFCKRQTCEIISENNKIAFEDNIALPYECLNLFLINGKLVGLKKKINFDLLRMMGINEEMLEDYIQKENKVPISWKISEFFKLKEGSYYNSNLVNFHGEIFFSQIEIKKFIQSNSSQKTSNQLIYFIYNYDRSSLNVNKIEKNFLTYFQLQQLSLSQQMSIRKSKIMKPCLIKPIKDLK